MPATLPDSLDPQAITWTRNRPRSVVTSDFTGFSQIVLGGSTFLSGELNLPALDASGIRDWQRFFGQADAGDGTFWVPIHSPDYDHEDSTGVSWHDATVLSVADRTITVANPPASIRDFPNQLGRNVQVRQRANNNISFVFTLLECTATPTLATLTVAEPVIFTAGAGVAVNAGRKVAARAILPDPESQTLIADYNSAVPAVIPWQEAVGVLFNELQNP